MTEAERQKKRVEEKIRQLDEEFRGTCSNIQENIHHQLSIQFEGFWFHEAGIEPQVPEIQDEENYHNVFEANFKHQVNTIIYWWRYRLRKLNEK